MATRFVDARGMEWEVWEIGARRALADVPASVSGGSDATSAPWLRFVSATQRRRLTSYPAGWEALGPTELAALCQAATPEAPAAVRGYAAGLADAMWLGEG